MAISGSGWEIVPINRAVAATGGANGMDARVTDAQSVRDCRLTDRKRPTIRVRSNVGLYRSAGDDRPTANDGWQGLSKNARRKLARYGK